MVLDVRSFFKVYQIIKTISSFSYFEQNSSVLFHCIDSHLEENGNWYSRFHIGPFLPNSRLQIGTRLRRSLLNDLIQTSIIAIELEGAIHEFSHLPGVREPVLELLFQFRKITFCVSSFAFQERVIVPFLFLGPGTFYVKDILWPVGVSCRNPKDLLATLAPGSVLRGQFLIQKDYVSNFVKKVGQLVSLGEFIPSRRFCKYLLQDDGPFWLSLGFFSSPAKRVGFRVECMESSNQKNEILIFEMLTNGIISPRDALYEAALVLVCKFSAIANIILPFYHVKYSTNWTRKSFCENFFSKIVLNHEISEQSFYSVFDVGFSFSRKPFSLDLRNLSMNKEGYNEFRNLGFQTLGQLLKRLLSDFYSLPYLLEKQRRQAFFRLGIPLF